MKIEKTITVTATTKEIKIISDFIDLFNGLYEETWHELNNATDRRLEDALDVVGEIYEMIEVEDDN